MAFHGNRIERRSNLLAEAIKSRVGHTYRALTEPEPAFQVKVPEQDQVKIYQQRVASGELATLRESAGGPMPDAEVDRYVQHMERAMGRNVQSTFGLGEPLEEDYS